MTLSERNRSRVLWTLVALGAIYGIITVLVYEFGGTFGTAWFATSLVVYGSLLVAGVAMALLDAGREPIEQVQQATEEPATTGPEEDRGLATLEQRGFELVSQESLYETPTGRVVRARFRLGEETEEVLFAISRDVVMPVGELEALLDETDLRVQVQEIAREVDQATQERARREPVPVVQAPGGHHGNGRRTQDPHPTEV